MMKNFISTFCLILTALLSSSAVFAESSDEYLISQAYFEDKSNSLSLSQIEEQQFTPYQNTLTGGYRSGTFWLRLTIASSTQPLILKIRPLFTEEIEIFDIAFPAPKPWVGNKYPWSASDLKGASYNFELAPYSEDRDIYLRVKSVRSYLINAEVMNLVQYQTRDRIELLTYAAYSAVTLLLAVWLLASWLVQRELVLGIFTIQQIFAFLHTLLHGGLVKIIFNDHLDPIKLNSIFSFLVVTYPFFALLANRFLLLEYGLKRSFKFGFDFLLLLSGSIIILNFLTDQPLTFSLNSLLVFVLVFYFLVAALFGVNLNQSTLNADALSINTLRVFYTFNFTLWTIAILPLQGWVPAGELALHSLHIYSIVIGLVFFFLLQYRAKALLKIESNRATALKLESAHERQQREEQAMLMTMLSHEIKTPLSVLKLVVDEKVAGSDLEGHANRAVNNIDFIIERCLQLGRIDSSSTKVNKDEFDINKLITELTKEHKIQNVIFRKCNQTLILHSDRDILRIIISNLMENAVKYSAVGSALHIETQELDLDGKQGIQVGLANDVGPMGAPDPEQVFKKYYRNSAATKVSGSGLGLYLVHALMQLLGGTASYQIQQNKVIFKLWIPS